MGADRVAGNVRDTARLFHDYALLYSRLEPGRPILLKASPYRFHPSWLAFERHVDRLNITLEPRGMFRPEVAYLIFPGPYWRSPYWVNVLGKHDWPCEKASVRETTL
ncbi:uncharacterized protein B0H64DRAFT_435388 [Chaetomium fimeti]|uniref:Uncharacterized protein n=1 Tax=Chaetomium fimeti TaxID=1854472 RepID=A0AAE0H9Y2_9PEZI|nr:hypothetical protein B0H64DRAFT_435388 [Chaetomium fimeti]